MMHCPRCRRSTEAVVDGKCPRCEGFPDPDPADAATDRETVMRRYRMRLEQLARQATGMIRGEDRQADLRWHGIASRSVATLRWLQFGEKTPGHPVKDLYLPDWMERPSEGDR